jgi:hypothetical protein
MAIKPCGGLDPPAYLPGHCDSHVKPGRLKPVCPESLGLPALVCAPGCGHRDQAARPCRTVWEIGAM